MPKLTDEQWDEVLNKLGKYLESPAFIAAVQDTDRIIDEAEANE